MSGYIVRPHLASDAWRPKQSWPNGTSVQWGRHGLVLSSDGDSYTSAFFESFPQDGAAGFIRGEGVSLELAEEDAFEQWTRMAACHQGGGHQWSRSRQRKKEAATYLNGGCICRRCGAFSTAMKPVVILGQWRRPISEMELSTIAMGTLLFTGPAGRPDRYHRRLALRAKLAGVQLPVSPTPHSETGLIERPVYNAYVRECEEAVAAFLLSREEEPPAAKGAGAMDCLFSGLSSSHLKRVAKRCSRDIQPVS